MLKRINKIIKEKNLSASQLAKEVSVQRSSVSHILSGRNRPSLDFVQKLLAAYPDLNPSWLIMGEGSIYKDVQNDVQPKKTIEHKNKPDLFSENKAGEEKNPAIVKDEDPAQYLVRPTSANEKSPFPEEKRQKIDDEKVSPSSDRRIIKRIILVYEDNSFQELFPSSQGL